VKLRRTPPNAIPLPFPGLGEPPLDARPGGDAPTRPDAPARTVPPPAPAARAALAPFRVEVVRSTRRKRTSAARLVGDTLEIRLPAWMSAREEAHWVEEWTRRFARKASTDRIDLSARAVTLARRHDLPLPARIAWADGMRSRWASCTPAERSIRISTALAPFPDWVVDYVIVHELAHLEEPGHTPAFWHLVDRYPKTERARGYLLAKGGDDEAW
jgi:predicted metal-dependent hydrolase